MASLRHKPLTPREEHLLSAAKACVLAVGLGQTTLSQVARRAKVSRMTVYRHYPDTATLLAALMAREFGALLAGVMDQANKRRSARARLVDAIAAGVHALARHPLYRRILDVDPQALLPYLVARLGKTQRLVLSLFGQLIEEGQVDGSVRGGNPRVLALSLLLAVQSFLISARLVPPSDRRGVERELRTLVDRTLSRTSLAP